MVPQTLTEAERPVFEGYLANAQTAWHKLMAGEQEVSVSYNGESVTYRSANMDALKNYISDLRRALGLSPLVNPGLRFRPVVFGTRRGGGLF